MIGLDDAHQCFQRCAWSDSFIRIILVNHLDLTDCEYTKKLCKLYLLRAIFAKDLNFFVHSSRLFVEISYLCHRILQRVQNILLTFRYELPPLNRIDRARLLSKECTHNSVGSPLDNRGCGRPVAEMAVCAVSVSRG
jgi:hypothetical protein